MSVSSTTAINTFTGNDLTETFTWDFWVPNVNEIEVVKATFTLDDNLERVWSESTLAPVTDYTITRNSDGTGSITLTAGALALDYKLAIRRKMNITQEVDFKNQTTFNARSHETAFDRVVYIAQQIQENLDRAVKLHVTDNETFDTTLPPDAGSNPTATIMVNEDGDGFAWGPDAADVANAATAAGEAAASAAAAATSASQASDSEDAAQASSSAAAAASASISGIKNRLNMTTTTISSTATLSTGSYFVRLDSSGGPFTLSIPSASGQRGVHIVFKKISTDGNTVTLDVTDSGSIEKETSFELSDPTGYAHLISDNTEYWKIG